MRLTGVFLCPILVSSSPRPSPYRRGASPFFEGEFNVVGLLHSPFLFVCGLTGGALIVALVIVYLTVRKARQDDLPQILQGVSCVLFALSSFLPWSPVRSGSVASPHSKDATGSSLTALPQRSTTEVVETSNGQKPT